jgi:hypothetical protein
VPEEQFLSALLEEGAKVIQERFGETIDVASLAGVGPQQPADPFAETISLTPVEASPRLPGRAARRV